MKSAFRGAGLITLLLSSSLIAQVPTRPQSPQPPQSPQSPISIPNPFSPGPVQQPGEPRLLPPNLMPNSGQQKESDSPYPQPDSTVKLPLPETIRRLDYPSVTVRRQNESWQLWSGTMLMRDFGSNQIVADEALRAIRDLKPTEWGTVGTNRVVVEYGLTNGKPATWAPNPKWSVPVDLKSVRAENVRGAWVVKDDNNILLNFGSARIDAEQAAAIAKKYGFNRVGLIGFPNPAMAYYYVTPNLAAQTNGGDPTAALARAAQEQNLSRTGIPVPGVGFVGERIPIDHRKVEVRKDRNEFVLAYGTEVITRFGQSEWAARDALKVVQECRFTEFCTLGNGTTFFLVNGAAPTRVPFSVQGVRFDAKGVKARPTDGRWAVYEAGGRMLFPAASEEEANQLVRIIQAFQFDQLCQVGLSPRASMKFFAKTGR